jgi:hypothetical protein
VLETTAGLIDRLAKRLDDALHATASCASADAPAAVGEQPDPLLATAAA